MFDILTVTEHFILDDTILITVREKGQAGAGQWKIQGRTEQLWG